MLYRVLVGVVLDGVVGVVDGDDVGVSGRGLVVFLVELEELLGWIFEVIGVWVGGFVVFLVVDLVFGVVVIGLEVIMFMIYLFCLGDVRRFCKCVLNWMIDVDVLILNIFWVVVFLIGNFVLLFYDDLFLI